MRDFQISGRSTTHSRDAMCATSHPLTVKIRLDILGAGDDAVGAAIGAVEDLPTDDDQPRRRLLCADTAVVIAEDYLARACRP